MARKTKEEAVKTRGTILKAAEKCFYQQGVAQTSLQHVAQAADVTRGAVYWHFKDKIDLLIAITDEAFLPHEELLNELAKADLESPLSELHKLCSESYLGLVHSLSSRRVFTILNQRCEYVTGMERLADRKNQCHFQIKDQFLEILKRAKRKGELAPPWTPITGATALQAIMTGLLENEMNWPRPDSDRDKTMLDALNAFFKTMKA